MLSVDSLEVPGMFFPVEFSDCGVCRCAATVEIEQRINQFYHKQNIFGKGIYAKVKVYVPKMFGLGTFSGNMHTTRESLPLNFQVFYEMFDIFLIHSKKLRRVFLGYKNAWLYNFSVKKATIFPKERNVFPTCTLSFTWGTNLGRFRLVLSCKKRNWTFFRFRADSFTIHSMFYKELMLSNCQKYLLVHTSKENQDKFNLMLGMFWVDNLPPFWSYACHKSIQKKLSVMTSRTKNIIYYKETFCRVSCKIDHFVTAVLTCQLSKT